MNIRPVEQKDLEKATIHVPGDGQRLLMALYLTEHDAGADGVTIIAMASTPDELLKACLEENLSCYLKPENYPEHVYWREQFGIEQGWGEGNLQVLDIPVFSVRSLSLESRNDIEKSIERIQLKAAGNGLKP